MKCPKGGQELTFYHCLTNLDEEYPIFWSCECNDCYLKSGDSCERLHCQADERAT